MNTFESIVVGDKVYRSLFDDHITEKDIIKARMELNETEETRESALRTLKEMLASEKDMNPRMDDKYLLRFLRTRKFHCDRALKTMKDYYKSRIKYPFVYGLPSQYERTLLKVAYFPILPYLDSDGRLIFNLRCSEWNPEAIPYKEFVGGLQFLAECMVENPVIQINGIVGILDFKGFSFAQLKQFFPIKRMLLIAEIMQGCFPARLKMLYVVNPIPLTYTLYRIVRPLIKEKFRDRIKILCKMEELYEFLDPAILHPEHGGHLRERPREEMIEWALSREEEIKYDRKFGYPPKRNTPPPTLPFSTTTKKA